MRKRRERRETKYEK
jgi:hypothetical protein